MNNRDLKKRIIDLSFFHTLSHLGSCLTAVDLIEEIYQQKKPTDPFVLSCGHAGVALYVVLEKHEGHDAEALLKTHGIHPNRDMAHGIWCSSGSLGQGLPIAVGMAFADRNRDVYCVISDGECAEGSIWEALRTAMEYRLENLHVWVNMNGYAAYRQTSILEIPRIEKGPVDYQIRYTDVHEFPFLQGQDAHYHALTKEEYAHAQEILS